MSLNSDSFAVALYTPGSKGCSEFIGAECRLFYLLAVNFTTARLLSILLGMAFCTAALSLNRGFVAAGWLLHGGPVAEQRSESLLDGFLHSGFVAEQRCCRCGMAFCTAALSLDSDSVAVALNAC